MLAVDSGERTVLVDASELEAARRDPQMGETLRAAREAYKRSVAEGRRI